MEGCAPTEWTFARSPPSSPSRFRERYPTIYQSSSFASLPSPRIGERASIACADHEGRSARASSPPGFVSWPPTPTCFT